LIAINYRKRNNVDSIITVSSFKPDNEEKEEKKREEKILNKEAQDSLRQSKSNISIT
jgi:hypothetical protein